MRRHRGIHLEPGTVQLTVLSPFTLDKQYQTQASDVLVAEVLQPRLPAEAESKKPEEGSPPNVPTAQEGGTLGSELFHL